MEYNKVLDILSQFTKTTILQIDIQGNILKQIYNSNESIKSVKGVNIKNIFSLDDRERVSTYLNSNILEGIKCLKILNKYSKGNQYVNLNIKDIEGNTYVFLESTQSKKEKDLRYEAKINTLIKQAQLDNLTGLLNRHAYWERVQRIFNSGDSERKIGIIFIDIDELKKINDEKGHKTGDKAINQIANLISTSIRDRDIAVRYGGDEFIIVVEEMTGKRSTAYGLAKRLVREINSKKDSFLTTVSIGVHITKVGDIFKKNISNRKLYLKWEQQVSMADKASYKAKKMGRNRVFILK